MDAEEANPEDERMYLDSLLAGEMPMRQDLAYRALEFASEATYQTFAKKHTNQFTKQVCKKFWLSPAGYREWLVSRDENGANDE